MNYYRIEDSFTAKDRWHLKSPQTSEGDEIDPRSFTEGREYKGTQPLWIPVRRGTKPLDFTLGAFDMPVATKEVAEKIQRIVGNDIQRTPVKIVGDYGWFEILNVLTIRQAINENLSEVKWWTEEMGVPEKIGHYFGIGKLVLHQKQIEGAHIFRLKDWELPLIVSDQIKNCLEEMNASGIAFRELQSV